MSSQVAYWPWWLGGAALAVITVGFWRTVGRGFGVSGSLEQTIEGIGSPVAGADALSEDPEALEAALRSATIAEFGTGAIEPAPSAPAGTHTAVQLPREIPWTAHAMFLVAIAVGGALGAISRGEWRLRMDFGADFSRLVAGGWRAMPVLLLGGALVGFGTRMAGGCTSGHGLTGCSRLQRGSLVATSTFFGVAVVVSFALRWMAH